MAYKMKHLPRQSNQSIDQDPKLMELLKNKIIEPLKNRGICFIGYAQIKDSNSRMGVHILMFQGLPSRLENAYIEQYRWDILEYNKHAYLSHDIFEGCLWVYIPIID
jgi:hypothetical protein